MTGTQQRASHKVLPEIIGAEGPHCYQRRPARQHHYHFSPHLCSSSLSRIHRVTSHAYSVVRCLKLVTSHPTSGTLCFACLSRCVLISEDEVHRYRFVQFNISRHCYRLYSYCYFTHCCIEGLTSIKRSSSARAVRNNHARMEEQWCATQ